MFHPAGSIYERVFIRDKLKFKADEAQTQITPPASLFKLSFVLQCLSLSFNIESMNILKEQVRKLHRLLKYMSLLCKCDMVVIILACRHVAYLLLFIPYFSYGLFYPPFDSIIYLLHDDILQ